MDTILHIGAAKTGTTALQEFFDINRNQLAKQGILYTRSLGEINNIEFAMYGVCPEDIQSNGFMQRNNIKTAEAKQCFDQNVIHKLNNEIKNAPQSIQRLLISSEHLTSPLRKEENVKRIRHLCDIAELNVNTIIYYIREQAACLFSEFTTQVLLGESKLTKPLLPGNKENFRFNYYQTISMWENCFPEAEIIVKIYDKKQLLNSNIIEDFAHIMNIDLQHTVNSLQTANTSYSKEALSFLIHYNQIFAGLPDREKNMLKNSKTSENLHKALHNLPGTPIQPSDEEKKQVEQLFCSYNEKLRKKYFPDKKKLF